MRTLPESFSLRAASGYGGRGVVQPVASTGFSDGVGAGAGGGAPGAVPVNAVKSRIEAIFFIGSTLQQKTAFRASNVFAGTSFWPCAHGGGAFPSGACAVAVAPPMTPPDPAAPFTPSRRASPSPWALAGTFLPLYALDQGTKYAVVRDIPLGTCREVVPGFFELWHSTNRGAAFGMFQGGGVFFLALALVALVVLAVLWRQGTFAGRWSAAGVCLLVPGILGNVTDRVVRGHVVDFLSFDLHFPGAHPFATFNVADSCICVAVGCFLIGSFAETGTAKKEG